MTGDVNNTTDTISKCKPKSRQTQILVEWKTWAVKELLCVPHGCHEVSLFGRSHHGSGVYPRIGAARGSTFLQVNVDPGFC